MGCVITGSTVSALGERAFSSLEILISVIFCVTGKELEGILSLMVSVLGAGKVSALFMLASSLCIAEASAEGLPARGLMGLRSLLCCLFRCSL